jgi:cytochrome oxidase Cu insertion factor (SCO1/SenC/PrrC family)
MDEKRQKLTRIILMGIIFLLAVLCLAGLLLMAGPKSERPALPIYGQIADFTLTNEDGQPTTLADLTNHVWVADIVFTRCAGPCPRMTAQMKSLQDALPQNSDAKLITLTTDPDFDSPEILKRYGARFGADFKRWMFLTGTKSEIAGLAAGSLKLGSTPIALADRKDPVDLFIHTTIFVVVDKRARMRGIFQTGGEDVDWQKTLPNLLSTIRQLEGEP